MSSATSQLREELLQNAVQVYLHIFIQWDSDEVQSNVSEICGYQEKSFLWEGDKFLFKIPTQPLFLVDYPLPRQQIPFLQNYHTVYVFLFTLRSESAICEIYSKTSTENSFMFIPFSHFGCISYEAYCTSVCSLFQKRAHVHCIYVTTPCACWFSQWEISLFRLINFSASFLDKSICKMTLQITGDSKKICVRHCSDIRKKKKKKVYLDL